MTTPILTVKEVAAELRCGLTSAYVVARQIGFRLGQRKGTLRVTRDALTKWMTDRSEQQWAANEHEKVSINEAASGGSEPIRSKVCRVRLVRRRSREPKSTSKSASDERLIQVTQPRTRRPLESGSVEC